jgi:hypothetical protein
MLKIVLLGMWLIAVTAGAVAGSGYLASMTKSGSETAAVADMGVEDVKADMTSVPMVRGGEVVGYLIVQLSFAVDKAVREEIKIEPLPFVNDAAFRVIFGSSATDFRRITRADIEQITNEITDEVNARVGKKLVRNTLVQQLNFVRREDIRTNWIGTKQPGTE